MADKVNTIPTRDEIDALIGLYNDAQAGVLAAQGKRDILRDQLMDMIVEHGFVPPRAKKSKRLQGAKWQANMSQGQSVDLDGTAVARFMAGLKEFHISRYFRKIFTRRTVYVLADGAQEVLNDIACEPRGGLRRLFNECLLIENNSPRIETEPLKEKAKDKEAAA